MKRGSSALHSALIIREAAGGDGDAKGIEDGENVDRFLSDGPGDWRKIAEGGEEHPENAQRHSANGALQCDLSHPPADVQELIDLLQ